jgi:hypothetical protein
LSDLPPVIILLVKFSAHSIGTGGTASETDDRQSRELYGRTRRNSTSLINISAKEMIKSGCRVTQRFDTLILSELGG